MGLDINEFIYEDSLAAHYRNTNPWEVRILFTGQEDVWLSSDELWMTSARYPGYVRIFFKEQSDALLFKLRYE